MYNILVVDDDKEIVGAIEIYLKKEGYNIIKAYNGQKALEVINSQEIHLVILDIMMPKKDGLETLKEIRKEKSIPVILLSAKSEDYDKIEGLDLGADDYITKPFNPLELIARVNSNLRRYVKLGSIEPKENEVIYKTGGLIINDEKKTVSVDDKQVKLTATEYNILKFLLKNKGKFGLVHRTERLDDVIILLKKYNIEPKKIQFIYPKIDKPSNLFLLEGVKNTGKGIKVLKPLIVHDKKNNYSQEIKEIFKI